MAQAYRPGVETVRFRHPTNANTNKPKPAPILDADGNVVEVDKFGGKHAPQAGWKKRHGGLLQDLVGRQSNGPFIPSFSLAVRLLLLVRASAAMYSNIQDCDEVFNFLEPLHYFTHNTGFQTWELSPEYAIRSWTYILLHWPLARLVPWGLGIDKRAAFFCLRISLGIISTLCEAAFYRAVVENINERVGRYCLVMLLGSTGMWGAGVSFLPSTFTMYTTLLAYTHFLPLTSSSPSPLNTSHRHVRLATFFFCLGPLLGWPFAGLLALPFILEQVGVASGEVVGRGEWGVVVGRRVRRLVVAGVASVVGIAAPIIAIDSWAYGKLVFPNLNIILYNVFSRSGSGSDLYGTEPSYFYLLNLLLNFNILLPLALLSLPALAITYFFDFKRLGKSQTKPKEGESSPYTLLAIRLSGFYLWLGVLSAQAHKEERFMYPAYPLLCLNAAVTVFLVKGWVETAYVKITASPYQASRSKIFSRLALSIVLSSLLISVSRIYALGHFYHAPFDVIYHFQYSEVPHILSSAGYKPIPPPPGYQEKRDAAGYNPEWDYSVLAEMNPKVRLCYGKEWYRFPSSFLVPEGIEVDWIKSEFDGMMPKRWYKSLPSTGYWPREETRSYREGRFNDRNEEIEDTYVDVSECTYLIDSSFPSQAPTELEPNYTTDVKNWERLFCAPMLDAASTPTWARMIYIPGKKGEEARVNGELCLLRNRNI